MLHICVVFKTYKIQAAKKLKQFLSLTKYRPESRAATYIVPLQRFILRLQIPLSGESVFVLGWSVFLSYSMLYTATYVTV